MRVSSITLTNFGPFETAAIPISDGLTVIRGPNGGGKSSVVEALRWLVQGRAERCDGGRLAEDSLVKVGSDEVCVVGVFDDVRVERSRRKGRATRLVVEVDDRVLSGPSAQDTVWRDVVGAGTDVYSSVLHVAQGRVTALADATDAERRSVLLSWCGEDLETWDRGVERARSDRSDARRAVADCRARLDFLEERASRPPPVPPERDPTEIATELDAVVDRLVDARARSAAVESARRAYETLVARHDRLVRTERPVVRAVSPVPEWDDGDALASAVERRRTLLPVASGTWSGGCPITRGECPSRDHVASVRADAVQAVARLDDEIGEMEAARRDVDTARAAARDVERANVVAVERARGLDDQIASARAELDSAVPPPDSTDIDAEIRDLEARKRVLSDELAAAEAAARAVRSFHDALLERDGAARALVEAERALSIRNAIVRAIDAVAGPAAVAGLEIESRSNELLSGTGVQISFRWSRPTKQRVSECPSCGTVGTTNRASCGGCGAERPLVETPVLGIDVTDEMTSRDLRFASGGQRQIVCLAARLATCPGDTIVLDEVDSALDERMGRVAACILRKAADDGLQVVVVSHNPNVWAVADTEVVVAPSDRGSVVEVSV